jgi:hypothetical protein
MIGKSSARTPTEYLASLEEPRRSEVTRLHRLIRKAAPGLAPRIESGMLAYGRYHYRYASGREGDWFVIGLASQKRYISLYVCATDDEGYVAESFKDRLPRASIGKSCVRIKRLDDVDLATVEKMVARAAKLGGAFRA